MTARPWFKFHRGEWLGSHRLRTCSLEARGLWVDVMALSDDDGYVRVEVDILASMARVTPERAREILGELERLGVLHRGTDGQVLVRTIARDHAHVENGRRGGLRASKTDGGTEPHSVAPAPKLRASGSGSGSGSISGSGEERGVGGRRTAAADPAPKPKPKRGPNVYERAWNEAWEQVKAEPFAWARTHSQAICELGGLPGVTPAEITRRTLKLLRSDDPWHQSHQVPRQLLADWSKWTPERPPEPQEPLPPPRKLVDLALPASLFLDGGKS